MGEAKRRKQYAQETGQPWPPPAWPPPGTRPPRKAPPTPEELERLRNTTAGLVTLAGPVEMALELKRKQREGMARKMGQKK